VAFGGASSKSVRAFFELVYSKLSAVPTGLNRIRHQLPRTSSWATFNRPMRG